jgi:transposase
MRCKRDTDGRSFDHHSLQLMRQQAVKAVRNGQSAAEVAVSFGVNERTVFRWLASFASGGQTALLAKPIPGRPMLLSPKQMQWLVRALKDKTPQQWKFDYALWTLGLVRQLIENRFAVALSRATVSRLLRLLGFSVQRPLYRAWQQDPVLVERWQTEQFPRIRAEAKKVQAQIFFADESGVRSDYHAGTTWAPRGATPVVKATGARFGLNMLSAVSARGEFRFMLHEGTVNAQVFREFLRRLMIGQSTPVFLIVDGHPAHRARLVREFVEQQGGRLKLWFLPPYSPELNPDELVWGHVKQAVAKKVPQTKAQLKQRVLGALRRLQKLPDQVASFFRHPTCQYAR